MRCRYVRKKYQNEENGYTVAVYQTEDITVPLAARDKYLASRNMIGFTAVGYSLPCTDEIELEMEGEWENSSYGLQFKVENFLEIVPRTKAGIVGYLSSGAIKGIREKTAEAIYREFGLDTLEVMEKTPEKLLRIRGISERKLKEIEKAFGQNRTFRELMTFLAPYKVSSKKVNMILQTFREDPVSIIRQRPFMLCAVKGFGFLSVDEIGRQMCKSLDDPIRISGGISYVLHESMKAGHLFMERRELTDKALALLNRELAYPAVFEQQVSDVLYRLIMQKSIVMEGERIYISQQYEEEDRTAAMTVRKILSGIAPVEIEKELNVAQQALGISLSDRQKQAVRMVFQSPISIITGGPGTGKTTVLKVILYIHGMKCRSEVQLMAPTGRAARRMAESTGNQDASTMHMALGLLGGTDYTPEFEYLSAEFLNVDETSMVDMHLAYEFIRRLQPGTRVLLLGDVDQLPSVGAGDVFRQLILCGLIPVTVLDLVYRQGAMSNIPVNARLMQQNRTDLIEGDDFRILPCQGAEATADAVKRIYLEEVARNGLENVQILTPYRVKTEAGVRELNRTLEDLVNPPVIGKKELKLGEEVFRIGDKVLQNRNTEQVSNGDMGFIRDFSMDMEGNIKVKILFSENRQVEYEMEQMEMVEHANAITIHKSQGSECQVVIIPWVRAFYNMLKRNILYTAVTRAKTRVYLVGERDAISQAIHTDDSGTRRTMLGERILYYYRQYQRQTVQENEQLRLAV